MSILHRNMSEITRQNMKNAAKRRIHKPCSEETKLKIGAKNRDMHYSRRTEFKIGHEYFTNELIQNARTVRHGILKKSPKYVMYIGGV